jgi:phosphoribosylanthranilate isomerase
LPPVWITDMMGLMSIVRAKICGITRAEDARVAIEHGAHALGFVFAPSSPRALTRDQAAVLVRSLPPFVSKVGLFVDASRQEILDVATGVGLDTVQLHGDEDPETCAAVQRVVPVVKAFRVRGPETVVQMQAYRGCAAAFLLDAYVPGRHGGTGTRFDWVQAVQAKTLGVPIILAGGLDAGNVAEAIDAVHPFAVDVSSGVESAPGLKDPEKLRAFLGAVSTARG